MKHSNRYMVARTVIVLAVLGVIYFVAQEPFRTFETTCVAKLLSWWGSSNVIAFGTSSLLIVPAHNSAFIAVITPSCSALASMLALIALGSVLPPRMKLRWVATAVAVAVVFAGNILRIALSAAVGLYYGRSSLVLFHDWVGGTFTFVYTLGGFMIMLFILLPSDRQRLREVRHVVIV